MSKIRKKWPFFVIGVSVETAEYSVPNIRLVLAEYSAEYSVFGRSLLYTTICTQTISDGFLQCSSMYANSMQYA